MNTDTDSEKIINFIEKKYGKVWDDKNKLLEITSLDLSSMNLKDISVLDELKNLDVLNLWNNEITNIGVLSKLEHLSYLVLGSNSIRDISALYKLKKLSHLNLWKNNIRDISALENLINLVSLDLAYNQIKDISVLSRLRKLTIINLTSNKIQDISSLKELKNLTSLSLSNNQIELIKPLEELNKLTLLDLSANYVISIAPLRQLKHISSLYLGNNQIHDVSALQALKTLKFVSLNSNELSDISLLTDLTNIQELYLGDNNIIDISALKNFNKLVLLDLHDNEIKAIPKELFQFGMEINSSKWKSNGINIMNNPLESPPFEIINQGHDAIKAYYISLDDNSKELNELKIIFIGEGGAGKTSLIRRILDNQFNKNESMTHGINIRDRDIAIQNTTIKTHFWDFGGQDIMHSTHQFFLSRRSLYVLVLDGRKEEDSEYWLNFIKSFGGNSPVIIVLNKIDDNESFEVNRKFLKEKYPNIVDFYRLSCLGNRGVDEFYSALKQTMLQVEFIRMKWPKNWFAIKSHIENLRDNFINKTHFESICIQNGIDDEQTQKVLSDYLDALGIAIHFNDFELKDIHTLKPEWVTNGVYSLITSQELNNHHGVLNKSVLSKLLDKSIYPSTTHQYIIDLMEKFELCYSISKQEVLIPALLEIEEKIFDFDYTHALRFELEYNFLPKSIIPVFIVKSHEDIKDKLRWRTGVVLEDKKTKSIAVVKVDIREKRIYIYVNGDQKRDFFAVIRKRFHDINSKFNEIEVIELIPLPEYQKEKVEYLTLIGYEQMGEDKYLHGKIKKYFSVSKLLNGIEKPEHRRGGDTYILGNINKFTGGNDMGTGNISVGGNVTGDITGGDKIDKSVNVGGNNSGIINTGNHNTITQTITTSNTDLKALLEAFQTEANKVVEALPEEKQTEFKDDAETFIEKAQENKLDKYFNVSKEGLLEAAKAVGEVGLELAKKIPEIVKILG